MTTVVADAALPTLARALDPTEVERLLGGRIQVRSARLVRHKPGRRCLIEYDLETAERRLIALGKIRANRPNRSGFRLLTAFWRAGFDDGSADGISVPEPLALLPELQMWLQRKVPGKPASELLSGPRRRAVANRVAEAAAKLHRAGVPGPRTHDMADELRILRECLGSLAHGAPLLPLASTLAEQTPAPRRLCGIHRDFYGDQVIVDGDRITIVDLDLYCIGDPALDVGNFVGHVTEQSLRTLGDPNALGDVEAALEQRFAQLEGEDVRARVAAYAALTLARHVYLSTLHPERRPFTEALADLARERLTRPVAA